MTRKTVHLKAVVLLACVNIVRRNRDYFTDLYGKVKRFLCSAQN
jgi:hypothetical protein